LDAVVEARCVPCKLKPVVPRRRLCNAGESRATRQAVREGFSGPTERASGEHHQEFQDYPTRPKAHDAMPDGVQEHRD
jgi:hypothetical protein